MSLAPLPLVIIGAGGFGREVLDVVEAINREKPTYRFLGFLDDGAVDDDLIRGRDAHILGPVSEFESIDAEYVIGIGSPATRKKIDQFATSIGRHAATLVHPSAIFGADVQFGPGTIVCSHVSLTTHIRTGRHVHLNLNCTVGHDVVAHDYVTVMPGCTISGNVELEEGATLGTNCAVIQDLVVGSFAFVGAGAAVVRSVPARTTVIGVPARPMGQPGRD